MSRINHRDFGERPDPNRIARMMRDASNRLLDMVNALDKPTLPAEDKVRLAKARAIADTVLATNLEGMPILTLNTLAEQLFRHGAVLMEMKRQQEAGRGFDR